MDLRRMAAATALAVFTLYTARVTGTYGLAGFAGWVFHNAATTQVFVDLCLALTLALLALTADARQRGVRAWPYWVLTLLTGSIGPLTYWTLRPLDARSQTPATVQAREPRASASPPAASR